MLLHIRDLESACSSTRIHENKRSKQHIENIIYLPGEPVGRSCHPFRDLQERGGHMVTYSDLFTFVIMICAIITLIRNDKNKK
nr:MAG TPA: Membrane MotB of proton-channel complex MotA/MotB [Caudoviricetes sp.]